MNEEQIYYNNNGIKVSNARVIIENTTYSMANITSVSLVEVPANRSSEKFMIYASIFMMVWGVFDFRENWQMLLVATVLGIVGVVAYKKVKNKYSVIFGSSSGEKSALESTDKNYIEEIVKAINDAIVRGN